jgi:hypothetical protein
MSDRKNLLLIAQVLRDAAIGYVDLSLEIMEYADRISEVAEGGDDTRCDELMVKLAKSSYIQEKIKEADTRRELN